jgi:ABC-type branched-subunit amino acid transport system substrate-binding protein
MSIEDAGSSSEETARRYSRLAGSVDLLFGPYGSGPMTAVAERFAAGEIRDVVINHGGAVQETSRARVVSVIGPAERYWAGLGDVLVSSGAGCDAVAVLHVDSGFGRATAAGAVASLRAKGSKPRRVALFDAATVRRAVADVEAAGCTAIVGCGRIEDDLALGRALDGADLFVGLVVCGVSLAYEALGDTVEGWFGPAQWWPGGPLPPVSLPPGSDYPAAQALAAGLVAEEILDAAGSCDPDSVWRAARDLRTATFLGPFAVDDAGRQVAQAPHLVRWVRGADGLERQRYWSPIA